MKIELHSHSCHSSSCGKVPADQAMTLMKESGYDAVVLTDHYNTYNLERFPGTPIEQTRQWLKGYEITRAEGEKLGIRVIFGLEARIPGSDNDYLIFGVEPNFVLENPQLHELDIQGLSDLCHRYDALLVQAHPNRPMCTPMDHAYLDGIEVFNGNPRQTNNNDVSVRQAEGNPRLIRTSGSDFHQVPDVNRGGIRTDMDIRTSRDLAECLRSGNYELIITE